jgi:uncharacterized protein
MCCSALEIEEMKKPAGPLCRHGGAGGCGVYADRPAVCRAFECEWLRSRDLPAHFRPDRAGVILMEDESGEYRAVAAPGRPLAWRDPKLFAHLVAMAKSGRKVVAKAGLKAWRVFPSGAWGPTV